MSIKIAWRRRALHYSTVQEIRFRFTATARNTDNTNIHTHAHKQSHMRIFKTMKSSGQTVSLNAWSIMDGKTQSLNRNLENEQGLGLWMFGRTPLPSFSVMLFRWDRIHFEIWPLSVTFTHPDKEWTMIDLWAPMWSLYKAFKSSFNPVHEHSRWKRGVLALRKALSCNPCDHFGNDKRVLPSSDLSTDHCIHKRIPLRTARMSEK